jgi:CBS domain-containing protein
LSRKKESKQSDAPLKVEDAMVKGVITIDEEATVKEAAELMNKFEIGCLISVGKGKAMGIITERDVLKRIVADGKDASQTKVRDVMTTPLVVASPSMDLGEALKLMFQMKVKKLPVVDANRLVGLVSLTDIARFQPEMILLLKQLAAKQTAPKSIQKVVDYYIV